MNNSDKLIQALRTSGMRITPQRVAICESLAASTEHPTAQMIYSGLQGRFPTMSLATIYNTLETLSNLGVINVLGGAGDNTVHYDADVEPHINLACLACHRVIDLPSEYIRHVEKEVETSSGYRVLGARVLYYGLCPDCQAKAQAA
jgi:Fur family peroxide stress response transcriptional regulator